MSKNIRSQYIKNLVADKETLSEQLKANTKESLRSLLEDTVKDSLRDILNEDDEKDKDSFDVEDVNTDNTTDDNTTPEITDEPSTDDASADDTASSEPEEVTTDENPETTDEPAIDSTEGDSMDSEEDEMWKGLDQFKGENGEYDLTGMDSDQVIKVLKVMGPEDSVRVVKNDNGSVTLTDDETEKEYIIDIEGSMTGNSNEPVAAETSTTETEEPVMNEENLGYTDNYQNKTAMTTPGNNEPGKNVNSWEDKAVPTGTEKPWVGNKGDMSPYNKKVNEGSNECNNECNNECGDNCIYEVELNEDPIDVDVNASNPDPSTMDEQSRFGKANERGMHKTPKSSEDHTTYGSHVISREGEYTGNEPNGKVNESKNQELANMIRKANSILEENKELKKIANELREKINEAVVINASLAKVINLVTENSTTRNEKIDILTRFNNVKTINESNALYETISRELKSTHSVNNGTKLINEQLNENKTTKAAETQIYKSEDLNETLDFMRRLNRIK